MKGAVIHVLGDCVQSAGVALVSPENMVAGRGPGSLANLKPGIAACRGRIQEQTCRGQSWTQTTLQAKAGHGNNREHCICFCA